MTRVPRVLWIIFTCLVAASTVVRGQVPSDPTRPPRQWLAAQPQAASMPVTRGDDATPQLQSIIIGPTMRYAIIEGRVLGVGDRFDDARVVAVRATEVVLRSESGTQTLKLHPDVQKRPVKPVPRETDRGAVKAKRSIRLGEVESNVARGKK